LYYLRSVVCEKTQINAAVFKLVLATAAESHYHIFVYCLILTALVTFDMSLHSRLWNSTVTI